MDTSVWLASRVSAEPRHGAAARLLTAAEDGVLEGWTSVLTLLETAATVARQWETLPGEERTQRGRGDAVGAALVRLLDTRLRWIHIPGDLDLGRPTGGLRVPAMLAEGLALAPEAPLKTLDLLHLAAAHYANRFLDAGLERFATLNRHFLQRRGELRSVVGMSFEPPQDVVEALDL